MIRPLIVVGVENTEWRRDLVPVSVVAEEQKAAPKAGGTEKFRAFLREELKPAIAKRYRVTAESGILGESADRYDDGRARGQLDRGQQSPS